MSKSLQANLKKCAIAGVLGLLLVYVFVAFRVDFSDLSGVTLLDWYRMLCDAFTIPGLLMLMFALLLTISNEGALDGLGYVAVNGLKMLIPGAATKMERYLEYVERRRKNRAKGYGFLYVVGAVFLTIAAVFLLLFYTLY